jgi:hypothetical protein
MRMKSVRGMMKPAAMKISRMFTVRKRLTSIPKAIGADIIVGPEKLTF